MQDTRVTRNERLAAVVVTVMVLVSSPLVALGQQPADDIVALRQQVEAMQRELAAMQQRLDALEAARAVGSEPEVAAVDGAGVATSGAVPTPQAAESWTTLHQGMRPTEVRSLLGEPSRELTLSGQTVWYYYYTGVGGGSVMFSRGERVLSEWQRPPFHSWW